MTGEMIICLLIGIVVGYYFGLGISNLNEVSLRREESQTQPKKGGDE
jgi:hypothetical protein